MIRKLIRTLHPVAGRLSKEQSNRIKLNQSVGFVGIGPAVLLFNLPSALHKPDVPVINAADLFEANRAARQMGK